MFKLTKALNAWDTPAFTDVLKAEIEGLDGNLLPLQQGLSHSSYALDEGFGVTIMDVVDEPDRIRIKAGIIYKGIIPGCSCADDPTPIDEMTEYCEAEFVIDRRTAETVVTLLQE